MTKPKLYTVEGCTGTLPQICRNLGLNYNTVISRISRGMSVEEALSRATTYKKYTVNGFTGNLTEVCNHFGVNYPAVYRRVSEGIPIEDAIKPSVKISTRRGKIYTVNGFTGNLTEVCDHFEVPYGVVRQRLRLGFSLESALFSPVSCKKRRNELYTVDEFTGTIAQICKHFNICPTTVNRRMKGGQSFEEAIKQPTKEYKTYTVNGITGTVGQICNHFNIRAHLIEVRLGNGLSIEEAINVPSPHVPKSYKYKGCKLSLKEICKIENRDFVEVYNLLRYNHTLEYSLQNASVGYSEE